MYLILKRLFSLMCINDLPPVLSPVFKVVHGPKLQAMLTSVLKDIDVDELKELCLEQLEGMSKKRIRSVLSGQPMEDSSCTEDENGSEEEEEENDGFRQGTFNSF